MSISLRARFSIAFAILIIILTLILSLAIGQRSSEQIKDEIGNSLAETAYQMSDKLDHYMWSRSGEIEVLRELRALRDPQDPREAQALLDGLKRSFPAFSWVGLVNAQGIVISSTDGILEGADVSSRPVFQEGLKGHFIGDVHEAVLLASLLPNPSGEPIKFVDISTPVMGLDENLGGVLAAHLSWEWTKEIERSILKPLGDRKNAEVFIISASDNSILMGPKDTIGQTLNLESIQGPLR